MSNRNDPGNAPLPTDGEHRGGSKMAPLLGATALGLVALEVEARRRVGAGNPFATVKRSVAILATPDKVSRALADANTVGRLVEPAATVTEVTPDRWTWRVEGPFGAALSHQVEIVQGGGGGRLDWRSQDAAAPHSTTISIDEAGNDGSVVRAEVDLYPSSWLPLLGTQLALEKAVDRTLATALYRLRGLLETGEIATVTGQPSGLGEGSANGGNAMDGEGRGLGKVVYGDSSRSSFRDDERLADGEDLVVEASDESFPASDPPVFSRGSIAAPDVPSDTGEAPA